MSAVPTAEPLVSLAEAAAFLRIDHRAEEALLAGLIRTATGLCEAFLNQVVVARPFMAEVVAGTEWQGLPVQPVRAITDVHVVGEAGALRQLSSDEFGVSVDREGRSWIRLTRETGIRVRVSGSAGLFGELNQVPEPIRQGAMRLVAHLYSVRDGPGGEPPAAVTALWRPYRRMRLS